MSNTNDKTTGPEPGSYWKHQNLWTHVNKNLSASRVTPGLRDCEKCDGSGNRPSGRRCIDCRDGQVQPRDRIAFTYEPSPDHTATAGWEPSSNDSIEGNLSDTEMVYLIRVLMKAAVKSNLPDHPDPEQQWKVDHAREAIGDAAERFFDTAVQLLGTNWYTDPASGTPESNYIASAVETATSHHSANVNLARIVNTVNGLDYPNPEDD